MKNLLIMEPFCPQNIEQIKEAAGDCCYVRILSPDASDFERKEAIGTAHIIIGEPSLSEISRKQAPYLEWIQMTWAGTDFYTMRSGFPEGVRLINATGAFGPCIAEYMIGAILNLYRRFPVYHSWQRQGIWKKERMVETLEGKTVLVLGAGDIGCQFARRMKAFDTRVIGVRRTMRPYPDYFDEMDTMDHLDELLSRADIVACSLPNTSATEGLFDEARLLSMKPGSLLVNVGRGNLIRMDDLDRVLQTGHLYGAILDVTDPEPLPSDNPLWYRDNVIITPHISGPSFGQMKKTEERITDICCDNLRRYAAGEPLRNIVDLKEGYAAVTV